MLRGRRTSLRHEAMISLSTSSFTFSLCNSGALVVTDALIMNGKIEHIVSRTCISMGCRGLDFLDFVEYDDPVPRLGRVTGHDGHQLSTNFHGQMDSILLSIPYCLAKSLPMQRHYLKV